MPSCEIRLESADVLGLLPLPLVPLYPGIRKARRTFGRVKPSVTLTADRTLVPKPHETSPQAVHFYNHKTKISDQNVVVSHPQGLLSLGRYDFVPEL